MTDDTTRLINNRQTQTQETRQGKSSNFKGITAATAGGMVAGAASGATTTAIVSDDETAITDETIDVTSGIATPEQTILANDEGVRYAHVNADNFNDAFAQARQQVGAGGVFEYNGRLYGTYYADEWDSMSPQERADYQARVNEITPSHHTGQSHHAATTSHEDSATLPEVTPANAEMISAEPAENEIKVISIDSVRHEDGQIMNIAMIEYDNENAMLVDLDNNGRLDVLIHDDNGDGNIQDSEIHDISGAGIEISDLIHTQAVDSGDLLYASDDNMPDYINDADSVMTV